MNLTPPLPRRARRILAAALTVLWIAAFVATHVPERGLPKLSVRDITLHTIGFFVLGAVFWLALWGAGRGRVRRASMVILILAAYAGLDEATQPLVQRVAAWPDWLADVIGAVLATGTGELVVLAVRRMRRARKSAAGNTAGRDNTGSPPPS